MRTYFPSVYYWQNRDKGNMLDDQKFYEFLKFICIYAVYMLGVKLL